MAMRVLGIDPGTIHLGYGVVEDGGGKLSYVQCGVINLNQRQPVEERLLAIFQGLNGVVDEWRPELMAVEEPFVGENIRTALAIGRAEAIVLLVAAGHRLSIARYSPALVKQRVASYGGANKLQVAQMVRAHLGMTKAPEPADASDALAVAICHCGEARLKRLAERQLQAQAAARKTPVRTAKKGKA
jgi:crossover junction endodeoxyribonuclease RuvC